MSALKSRLTRGHFFSRARARLKRILQSVTTTAVLSLTRPRSDHATIVTLNADEENASVQAILLARSDRFSSISLLSPSPSISAVSVSLAAKRMGVKVPERVTYQTLNYRVLLREYRRCSETYSTHILLPGRDWSASRRHVHLTHGSGPKPDTTFASPANVLASITPQWSAQQLREYRMPPNAEIMDYMPRLEIMRRSIGDKSVCGRLSGSQSTRLAVWAPTYRVVKRQSEVRVSGVPLSAAAISATQNSLEEVKAIAAELNAFLIIKMHPHEADDYSDLGVPTFTNQDLRDLGVSPYELFGAADVLITDYSSLYLERKRLGLDYRLVQTDLEEFASSYRGLRQRPQTP